MSFGVYKSRFIAIWQSLFGLNVTLWSTKAIHFNISNVIGSINCRILKWGFWADSIDSINLSSYKNSIGLACRNILCFALRHSIQRRVRENTYTYRKQTITRIKTNMRQMQARMMATTHWRVPHSPNRSSSQSLKFTEDNSTPVKSTLHRDATRRKALQPSRDPSCPVQSSSNKSLALFGAPGGGHGKRSHKTQGSRIKSGAARHLSHFWHLGHVSASVTSLIVHKSPWKERKCHYQ